MNFDNKAVVVSFFVAIGGTILFAVGTLASKSKNTEMSTSIKVAIQLMVAGMLSILLAFLLGETSQIIWLKIPFRSILSLLYLIIFGSILAYLSYVWLLGKISPAIIGTYTYVNPLVAILLGWSVLDENITINQMASLFIILAGVILVNINKTKN